MLGPQVRGTHNALLVFTDIVDSSKFSAVLGYEEYAKRVIEFQETFKELGQRYFPAPADTTQNYTEVSARGDEGIVFVIDDRLSAPDLILQAIEFVFHLKGYLKLTTKEPPDSTDAPLQIGLGAGIHFGRVAFATEVRDGHAPITRIEGFSINYAKRVESSSRAGECSRVMLSRDALRLLEGAPVVFSRTIAPMNGIEDRAEVHEVRGGLFSGLRLEPDKDPRDEQLVSEATRLAAEPLRIDEPWLKSLITSILDVLIQKYQVTARQNEWREGQKNLAWFNSVEDDPILLYVRARTFAERAEHTQQLRYLRDLVQRYPGFVHARKRMIDACGAIAKKGTEPAEKVFARDMAKEFLERFPDLLTREEKDAFGRIVAEMDSSTKPREK